jgi:hypothetical protein
MMITTTFFLHLLMDDDIHHFGLQTTKLFFPNLWGRWTGDHPKDGFSQIWLEVSEKSRQFSKPRNLLAPYKNLLYNKYGEFNFVFLEIWRIRALFPKNLFWTGRSFFLDRRVTKFGVLLSSIFFLASLFFRVERSTHSFLPICLAPLHL